MPYRVPEGPVDPYEPFPLADPSEGAWTPAPIVRGRDLGRPTSPPTPPPLEDAPGAEFVDIEPDAPLRLRVDTLVSFDEPQEAPHSGDGASDLGRIADFGMGGDGFDSWAVVDGSGDAGEPAAAGDPWAVVDAAEAVYTVEEPEMPTEPVAFMTNDVPEAPIAPEVTPFVTRHAGAPPLSSRAVLIIGALALLCLTLAAALAFQAISDGDEPPAIDAPGAAQALTAGIGPQSAIGRNATWTSSLPVSDTTLTSIERAAIGPLETELDRLGRALQAAFGRSSAEVAPVLRPYIAHAAERMSTHPMPFRLVVEAPHVDLALTRAEAIMRAFEGAGVPADKLTMTAVVGTPAVRFES